MYRIGDKIVYPMHGAGVIEAIEEKEYLGSKQYYYVLKMPVGDLRVMIPTQNVVEVGIREVIKPVEFEKVQRILRDPSVNVTTNWNKRYRENMIKIKSGSIYEVADVFRSLKLRENSKGLSTGERKMLNSAKQILLSELVLVIDKSQAEIEEEIENCIYD